MQPQGNMNMNLEAFRRRAGQQPSSAGIPGGAPVANTISAGNPLSSSVPPSSISAPQPPQSATQEPIKQMQKSIPGQDDVIIKALIDRMKKIPVQGTPPVV